jgi:F0F1-type ATP synthase assembly protein I
MRERLVSEGKPGANEGASRRGAQTILQPLALATQLGVTMGLLTVFTALGGLLLGLWADRQMGTRPLAAILFVLAGVVAGLLGTVNLARSALRTLDAAAARKVQPRTSFSAADLGRALLLVVELSVVTLLPVGLGLWFGLRLDRAMDARPAFTIALAAVGLAIAVAGVFWVSLRAAKAHRL